MGADVKKLLAIGWLVLNFIFAVVLVVAIIAFAVSVGGCATVFDAPQDRQMIVKPQISAVGVAVNWISQDEATKRCGVGKSGCATIGTVEVPIAQIWAVMPRNFEDPLTCVVGEEFLHTLGARHP